MNERDRSGGGFRDLGNYKDQHRDTARAKGVHDAFMNASTLTQARRILFGTKRKAHMYSTLSMVGPKQNKPKKRDNE